MLNKTIYPIYFPNEIIGQDYHFNRFKELEWLQVTEVRKEYFMSDKQRKYTYGSGNGIRTYNSNPFNESGNFIKDYINEKYKLDFNICFLNRYENEKSHLGWHADDSPEMDKNHPIAIVSFGAEREIWWKLKEYKSEIPKENRTLLENGSLFIMMGGFQEYFYHKIPKSDRKCGIRISLTFRKYND